MQHADLCVGPAAKSHAGRSGRRDLHRRRGTRARLPEAAGANCRTLHPESVQRADQQVKIRGFRIELGEIEAALNQHEGVTESVVTVYEEEQEKRIVAYVVSEQSIGELRNYLRERLPEYMIPASFVYLE